MAGTAKASDLSFMGWEKEAAMAEVDNTYTYRVLPRGGTTDITALEHDLVDAGGSFQYFGERDAMRLGGYGVKEFSWSEELGGHGGVTSGALTVTDQVRLLEQFVGNTDVTQVGGAITTISADAEELTSTNTTLLAGGLCRVGVLKDTRADGQACVLTDATSTYDLDTALPGTPDTNDTIFAMQMVYPVSSASSGGIITSDDSAESNTIRMIFGTENEARCARGCFLTGLGISNVGPGGMPMLDYTVGTVYSAPIASITVPSATATDVKTSAGPNANGSLFIADEDTVTRTTDVPLDVKIDLGLGAVALPGSGGTNARQTHVGWRRTNAPTTIALTFEAQAQTATPSYYQSSHPTTAKHILWTGSTVDGNAWAIYFPRCYQIGNPTQSSFNGINAVTVTYECATDTAGADELTKSRFRIGIG